LNDFKNNLKDRLDDENDSIHSLNKNDLKKVKDTKDDLENFEKKNPKATAEEIKAKKDKEYENLKPILNKADKIRDLKDYGNEMKKRY
jgi:hypothetical protein